MYLLSIYFSLKILYSAIKVNSEKTVELYNLLNQASAYIYGRLRLSLGFRVKPNQSSVPPVLQLRDAQYKRRGGNRCISVTLSKEFNEWERNRSLDDLSYRQVVWGFFLLFFMKSKKRFGFEGA